ncbi:hypothetical protein BCR32DRAFT_239878 [Anaeromyces robustus]|jgi:hypothetical protein|uniref:Uncharacterized protein n=1 Tax=Anaeromyces robustus TaxID=1754192 RepID=A0A1Y1XPW0_9FUNG|nr:hypothetical protein BCR32DRAFT_239878 [Anaeromyces robustus]|eukprot:ORX87771.1 hypothetical protein BCR32DRAFT_239878 [Anaeromyces robustus]
MYRYKKAIPNVTIPSNIFNKKNNNNFVYPSPELDFGNTIEMIFQKHGIYDQLVNYTGEWSVKIESLDARPLIVSRYTSYDADPNGKTVIAVAHLSQSVISQNPQAPPSISAAKNAAENDDLYFDPLIEFELLPSGLWHAIGVVRWNGNYQKVKNYHDQLELDYYVNGWARRIHEHYIDHESYSIVTLN